MTHFFKCDPFWGNFLSVTQLFKSGPFFWVLLILPSVSYFINCDQIFITEAHISKYDTQVWPICTSVNHLFKCNLLWQLWPIFPSLIRFSECYPLLQVWLSFQSKIHFYKRDPFFQVWPSSTSVTSLSRVWPTFSSVTHFTKWPFFPSETHFSNCDQFLKV